MKIEKLIAQHIDLSESLKQIQKQYLQGENVPPQISKIIYMSDHLLRLNYILIDDLNKQKNKSEDVSFYFGMRSSYILLDLNTLILTMQNICPEVGAGYYFYYNLKRLEQVFTGLESILDQLIDSIYAPDGEKRGPKHESRVRF